MTVAYQPAIVQIAFGDDQQRGAESAAQIVGHLRKVERGGPERMRRDADFPRGKVVVLQRARPALGQGALSGGQEAEQRGDVGERDIGDEKRGVFRVKHDLLAEAGVEEVPGEQQVGEELHADVVQDDVDGGRVGG